MTTEKGTDMTTEIQHPAKMSELLTYLDREQIGYTISTERVNEYLVIFTVTSLDKQWFESTVVSSFYHHLAHTTEYGTRRITSTRHCTYIYGGLSDSTDTRNMAQAMMLWCHYGRRTEQAGA